MKRIIYIAGDPGTGKTSVGKEVAKKLKATFLDKDTICDPFTHYLGDKLGVDPKHSEIYNSDLRDIEYKIIEDILLENIAFVDNIVLVAPFGREVQLENNYFNTLENHIEAHLHSRVNISAYIVTCSPEENLTRLIERNKKDDVYKIKEWENYKKERRIGEIKEYNNHILAVINNKSIQETANLILDKEARHDFDD